MEGRKCLGALPDAYGLYPRLTAARTSHILLIQGMNRSLVNRRIDELNELLDMNDISLEELMVFRKVKG